MRPVTIRIANDLAAYVQACDPEGGAVERSEKCQSPGFTDSPK